MNGTAPINLLFPEPKMTRSYKAWCSVKYDGCFYLAHVSNEKRVGGVCCNCIPKVRSQWLLKRCIRSQQKRIMRKNQRKTSFLVTFRCMPNNTGGIGSGIAQTINNFL